MTGLLKSEKWKDRRPDRGYGLDRSIKFPVFFRLNSVRSRSFSGLLTGPANTKSNVDQSNVDQPQADQSHVPVPDISVEPRRSSRIPQPSKAGLQSVEYQKREIAEKDEGKEWATITLSEIHTEDHENVMACLTDTKASHHIPQSYKHVGITTDSEHLRINARVFLGYG